MILQSLNLKNANLAIALCKNQQSSNLYRNGGFASTLCHLAHQVLAQCASNSSLEINQSTYRYVHSNGRNRFLRSRVDKLVYLYCNNRLIKQLESDDYNEKPPRWTYDVTNEEEEEEIELQYLESSMEVCTSLEIEKNLAIYETLKRSSKRRKNC